MTDSQDTMRWIRRGAAAAAVVIGWLFIAWKNHFHISASVVFVGLGYLAVVATVYNLWRTGASAVTGEDDDDDDSTWAKPAGALGELEREKRTLLKAIKEAEFDHEMGKLSKRDADEMIASYRARAIEVIKDIERLDLGAAGTVREQIMREVRARIELEARSSKKGKASKANGAAASSKPSKPGKPDAKAARAAALSDALAAVAGASPPMAAVAPDTGGAAAAASTEAEPEPAAPAERGDERAASSTADEADADERGSASDGHDDEAMDADSTTALEPARDDSAKEATP